MRDRGYESDSSLDSTNEMKNETDTPESPEEVEVLNNVRNAVQTWKTRELGKNKETNANVQGFDPLRKYVSNSASLYYDLLNFLNTSKNNEKNMNDRLYVNIVSAIGIPGGLPFHLRTLLQHFLQRDLVELPYTVEPTAINAYAKEGMVASKEFPEEE
jgi:hypothetical protein